MPRTSDLFGSGPWDTESDDESFDYLGHPCRLLRSTLGFWCGYVGVPKGHPWFGKQRGELRHVRVHGSVTFAEPHEDLGGEKWWIGFDCGHSSDLVPAYSAMRDALDMPGRSSFDEGTEYRTRDYVYAQTTLLAAQAVAAQQAELLN